MPSSSSVETIARRVAKRKPGARGSRSTAIVKSPRSRAACEQAELRRPRP